MYKVSVLIPVFNSELHIEQCLRSAFSQTLDSIEYVIVDDACTDNSLAIIESVAREFPERSSGLSIIHHSCNMGPCAARRTALESASAEYVIHLDSDDWIEPDCYERMYQAAKAAGADVVCSGYVEETAEGSRPGLFGAKVSEDKEQRLRDTISLKTSPFIWSKMVKRSVYSDPGFCFPKYGMAEDWALSVQYALIAERWAYVDEALYHYRISTASVSHDKASMEKAVRLMKMEKGNVENVVAQLEHLSIADRYGREIEARKSNVKRFLLPFLSDKECYRMWKDIFKEINRSMLTNRLIPAEYRIKHLCALMGIYTQLYAVFKKITGRK